MPSPEAIKAAEEIHELARLPNGNYAPHLPLPSVLASVIDQAADEKYSRLIQEVEWVLKFDALGPPGRERLRAALDKLEVKP
jgi:hypothetical protein